jgi:DNA repair protein RadC
VARVSDSARILSEGPGVLSDASLMAMLLGTQDHLLACRLLNGGLDGLRRVGAGQLLSIPGVTARIAVRILAALELGRRVTLAPLAERRRLVRARDVAATLWSRLAHLQHEEFWVVLLTARLHEIACVPIARGGLVQCSVSPREAFAPALLHKAAAVAFVHNHPSGEPTPSPEDQRLQLLLEEAGRALGVRVIDHLVLAEGGIHSAVEGMGQPLQPVCMQDAG